jgi:hypothetical protein
MERKHKLSKVYVEKTEALDRMVTRVIAKAGGAVDRVTDAAGKIILTTTKDGTIFIARIITGTGKFITTVVFETVPENTEKLINWIKDAGFKIKGRR